MSVLTKGTILSKFNRDNLQLEIRTIGLEERVIDIKDLQDAISTLRTVRFSDAAAEQRCAQLIQRLKDLREFAQ